MSIEFETAANNRWLGLDAYSTHLTIELAIEVEEDSEIAITIGPSEARRLRRFLEHAYPASEDRREEIVAMLTKAAGEFGYTKDDVNRMWRDGTLHEPELHDLWVIWYDVAS